MAIEIEEIHVNEAIRIIREYDYVVQNLDVYTDYIENLKQSILKIKDDIDNLRKDNSPELKKQADLYELIQNHEIEINGQSKKIEPLLKKMDLLKADSFKLYYLLKEKYPGATDKQLKDFLNEKVKIKMEQNPNLIKKETY